ncbi:MAG: hypothetical protein HY428_00100 [Candidatus Levybacteria bacterium]|nr:hypothetical protein [Candidatus Levybacteria bacterium]
MDRKDVQSRTRAAYKLLLEETTTREKFESIRTLIKGINPQVDKALTQTSQAFADYEKLHKGEIIELTVEKLPEVTEEEKKRKKALLFLLRSWKQLQSEVERVQSEFGKGKESGDKTQDMFSRVLRGAKGPLGIVTISALVIAGALTVFSQKTSQQESPKPATTEEKPSIRAIEFKGKYIPLSELEARSGSDCDSEHYHAKNHTSVIATDKTIIPDPGACAYGKVTDVKVVEIE